MLQTHLNSSIGQNSAYCIIGKKKILFFYRKQMTHLLKFPEVEEKEKEKDWKIQSSQSSCHINSHSASVYYLQGLSLI